MSKSHLNLGFCYPYINDAARHKLAAKVNAALLINSSDPFHYGRVLNYLQRGIVALGDIEAENSGTTTKHNAQQHRSMLERVKFIGDLHAN